MKEHQHIEWKEIWRDEYLKWISGFANAEGGVLVIGRNDKGMVVGVTDAKRLLVDLPNKVRDILGIVVRVNLKRSAGKEMIEIVVDLDGSLGLQACRQVVELLRVHVPVREEDEENEGAHPIHPVPVPM